MTAQSAAPAATKVLDQWVTPDYAIYCGDCVEVCRALPDASVHLTVTSPPFSHLYTYSDSEADMGNSADDAEFFAHFGYLIPELFRVTIPGRLCAVHCKQLVDYAGSAGEAGLRDFRGAIIRAFEAHGWKYHSEVTIWTDAPREMQKTKANGLLYKTIRRDASFSRQGLAEYLVVFRRWPKTDAERALCQPVTHTEEGFPLDTWQRYASPVWFDINPERCLNVRIARDNADEKHLCPFSLDVVERAVALWSNPGDVVFDPFGGVGTVAHEAIRQGRKGLLTELKPSYAAQAAKHAASAVALLARPSIFDLAAGGEG